MTIEQGELVPTKPAPLAVVPQSEAGQVMALFERAFQAGGSTPEALAKLLELHDRLEAKAGRSAFFADLAAFQLEHQLVSTNRRVNTATSGGAGFNAPYASLPHLVRELQGPLSARGFSFSWEATVNDSGTLCTETFVLRHVAGHETRTPFTAPTESRAGMSPQQKYGAASSYAKRRAMLGGLGIVTEEDAGGEVAEKERNAAKVGADQVATINAMLDEIPARKGAFFKWTKEQFGVERVEDVPAALYQRVVGALEKERRK